MIRRWWRGLHPPREHPTGEARSKWVYANYLIDAQLSPHLTKHIHRNVSLATTTASNTGCREARNFEAPEVPRGLGVCPHSRPEHQSAIVGDPAADVPHQMNNPNETNITSLRLHKSLRITPDGKSDSFARNLNPLSIYHCIGRLDPRSFSIIESTVSLPFQVSL